MFVSTSKLVDYLMRNGFYASPNVQARFTVLSARNNTVLVAIVIPTSTDEIPSLLVRHILTDAAVLDLDQFLDAVGVD